jgi:hypothetical protein
MLPDRRVVLAQLRAHEDADELVLPPPDKIERQLNVAVGDPQASLSTFLRVLDLNGLLGDDGRLRPEVGLVSMGDHFDWGRPEDRVTATEDGTRILSWLAAHPPDQVQIIVGNHDLVRVGELFHFTDSSYIEARALADEALLKANDKAFLAKYPMLASAAVIARDYSCFEVKQRTLLTRLLKKRRVRLAVAPAPDLLLVHAGITSSDLGLLGLTAPSAVEIAATLNRFLDTRVAHWKAEGPLDLAPLHELGSAKDGEARGVLAHRPANPAIKKVDRANRRYDPRELPSGITQVIGHINDKKCRDLFGDWADTPTPEYGSLRGLTVRGDVRYHVGCEETDTLLFLDGAMHQVAPVEYELFDLELRQRLVLR